MWNCKSNQAKPKGKESCAMFKRDKDISHMTPKRQEWIWGGRHYLNEHPECTSLKEVKSTPGRPLRHTR